VQLIKCERLAISRKPFPVSPTGIEHPPRFPGKTAIDKQAAQKAAHFAPETSQSNPGLKAVIDAWPTLPEPIRAGILALVRAAGG
jgi:hypothetical protein